MRTGGGHGGYGRAREGSSAITCPKKFTLIWRGPLTVPPTPSDAGKFLGAFGQTYMRKLTIDNFQRDIIIMNLISLFIAYISIVLEADVCIIQDVGTLNSLFIPPEYILRIPPPAPGEKAWFEKLDPHMTQDLLNEMSQEFASIYKSCREWLALTRFVAKGIVKPSTPSPNPARSPAEEKEILPPPPPPPTFHKKVDLSEYKVRYSLVQGF
ncbi:unnamed protein product [Strongylus vulgaris]|uniref:Uncharacterized protein n=1 Tax=Strongylus vulgaris TaxID=40348 RepID=A0A3P7INQ0_STRVU|nr:unnamed protein product [Strongylus vulgaris]